jgi:hypothetical protein
MNTRESASGRSYKDVLVQAVHSLANSTGLQAVIEEMEPRQRVGATALAMAMIRKESGYYGDSDSAIALLVEVQKGVSETRRSWMCFD